MSEQPIIPVTTPCLPPLEEFIEYLRGIWSRRQLTNHGPLVWELERRLQSVLGIERGLLLANGALGLHLALRALDVRGTVLTTPFSYMATTSCPLWEGNRVVFADIEPRTLTIDPAAVEAAITPDVEAILATHVYGNPCDVAALERIAGRFGLALIYDAAHAFGVQLEDRSILEYGDLSMVSLHATKLFHTAEGGLMAGRHRQALDRIEWMRRFGHRGEDEYWGVGTNAKLSELHAALGLAILPHLDAVVARRRAICERYDAEFIGRWPVTRPTWRSGASKNWSYYPLLFESERSLLSARQHLSECGVLARRYFYPALHQAGVVSAEGRFPVSEDTARRVLCLPLSGQMLDEEVDRVVVALVNALSTTCRERR